MLFMGTHLAVPETPGSCVPFGPPLCHCHTTKLYNKVDWPALSERRDGHWKIFVYKSIIALLPPYLSSLISYCNTPSSRSQRCLSLHLPPVNTELGQTAFCYKAPSIWNRLHKSLELCALVSLREFINLPHLLTQFSCIDCNC